MLDHAVELAQPVAGHRGEHVVFGMVVHVPVKELDEGIEVDGAAAEAEIGYFVLEADVLGGIAEEVQPGAKGLGEGHRQKYRPVAGGNGCDGYGQMSYEDDAFPAGKGGAALGIALGK